MYLFAAKIQDMFYSVCGKFGVLSVLIDGDKIPITKYSILSTYETISSPSLLDVRKIAMVFIIINNLASTFL